MRVAIREQLAALVLFAVLIGLAILSIPTWIYVNRFVVGVETTGLSLTASLKAAQVASEIELIQTTCNHISTRLLIQETLSSFYLGNDTELMWSQASADISSALLSRPGVASNLIQARLYSRNQTGGDRPGGLLNVTGTNVSEIILPYKAPDGSQAFLGDSPSGYPPMLYPNITYYNSTDPDPGYPNHTAVVARPFPDIRIDSTVDGLVLGPLVVNESFALISLTIPIRSIVRDDIILGYMTTIGEASSLVKIARSREGLGSTGSVLLIGPSTGWNRFSKYNLPANATHAAASNFSDVSVKFVLPPRSMPDQDDRHSLHNYVSGNYSQPFKVSLYNAVYRAFTEQNHAVNNASSLLSTKNEQGIPVAVGYARPQTSLVNWTLVVEQDRAEAHIPIGTLQHILLGCVFGTIGLTLLLVLPCAHLSVLPIRRLRDATEKSIAPPGYAEAYMHDLDYEEDEEHPGSSNTSRKSGHKTLARFERFIRRRTRSRPAPSVHDSEPARRIFKIPGKVNDRKHYITDELTELTTTFNEMSDELLKQYTSLEEKVAERTHELQISKKAAEAANESKTLFIANISHELKTPLNGILGMCAVCMEEDDLSRIKQSLKTLYKSGDLLLHLLEDLLSFSKNQIGQQLSLEEKEFRLGDIRSQVTTIFDKQVRERSIDFSVTFLGTDSDLDVDPNSEQAELNEKLPAIGPLGTGRLKDMCLWGDQHRILQVLINLVSNSLKFTPAGGKVAVRIRCLREIEPTFNDSRTSSMSKAGSGRLNRHRGKMGSGSNRSKSSNEISIPLGQYNGGGTSLSINPMDPKAIPQVRIHERSPTPPPPSAKSFLFEFEVEDTGPGIPENMQQRVFEPFVQGDLGLSKKYGGTGLGLSICQQLAGLMGGSITLRSTVSVGTTFIMQIPLKYTKDRTSSTASSSIKSRPASINSTTEAVSRKSSLTLSQTTAEVKATVLDQQPRLVGLSQPFFTTGPRTKSKSKDSNSKARRSTIEIAKAKGKLRVLVAEDNPTNIEVVSKMLKLEDVYDVTIAKDGQEAYELVKVNMENNLHFDLIFMDIQMPNVDGLQSTRLIRQMGYSAPIVALTAFSEESNIQDCMESGMNEFLSKPIRRPALKQVLKKFATIPEEPETTSPTKETPERGDILATDQPPNGHTISAPLNSASKSKDQSMMNGAHSVTGAVT